MIPQEEINYVKENADLLSIVRGLGVELRKAGANYVGRCPFHKEKTGSFTVHPRNNHWKCYGCGLGGNVIDFVMKKQGCDFIEAVKYVAEQMHYTLTDDYHETDEQRTLRQNKTRQVDVNKMAMVWFQKQLEANKQAMQYCQERGWSTETLQQWEVGYAPNDFNALWDYLKKDMKVPYEVLTRSTLFGKNSKGGYFAKFRDRVMFPILDAHGDPIAFTGRLVPWHEEDTKFKEGKYVNSSGDEQDPNNIYVKGDTLFGWSFARPEVRNTKEAILVEGNPDTIRMHQIGVTNTVAACGTALTNRQAETLAAAAQRAILLYDSDKAGQKATLRNGRKLIEAGIMAYTLTIPDKVDEETGEVSKQDPDTFFTDKEQYDTLAKQKKSWFVYVAEQRKAEMGADPDPAEVAMVANELAPLLLLREEGERMGHIDQLAKIIPPKKVWNAAIRNADKKNIREINEQGYTEKQVKMINEYGFCEKDNSYCIQTSLDGGYHVVSNFVLEPLFHIESTVNAKRLYRLRNNKGVVKDLEIAQKDLVSLSAFKIKTESFGNFLFTGTDVDLNKIKAYLYENTKSCKEVEQLGWQKEGFWAWGNGVVDENHEWNTLDDLGTTSVKNQWYYIPATSAFFKADSTLFTFERHFVHTASQATLRTFTEKLLGVYGDNAIVATGFYLATLFRDFLYNYFDYFPLLNIFGQPGTGKTEMAIVLTKLFGNHEKGVNLTNTTAPGLAGHLSLCRNALVHVDEYKNSMEYNKIEALKAAFDGVGRSRINVDRDKKKETTPMDCGVILTGQERTTADVALFTRVIYLTVSKREFNKQEEAAFEDLKAYSKQGLTCITNELLSLRDFVIENYETQLDMTREEMRQATDTRHCEGRILQSWTMILAMLRTLRTKIDLPWDYSHAIKVFAQGLEVQNSEVKSSNEMAVFWNAVETLLTNGDIETDYDIKLYYGTTNTQAYKGSGSARKKYEYTQSLDVLYLNTSRVFKLYAKLIKSTSDNKSSLIDEGSLRRYLTAEDEYMGEWTKQFKVPTKNRQKPNEGQEYSATGIELKALYKSNRALVFNYAKIRERYGIDLHVESMADTENPALQEPLPY